MKLRAGSRGRLAPLPAGLGEPRRAAQRAAHSRWLGLAGRAGLAAQGVCFGLVGILAIGLALGAGGKATDPQGALTTLAQHTWSKVLLLVLCVGFACYATWRLSQAVFDRGGMGTSGGGLFRRAIQLFQGLTYVFLTYGAIKTLASAGGRSGGEKRAAAGILGWPAGRELVGLLAAGVFVTAGVLVYWAISRRFEESLATEEMGPGTERLVRATGIVGLCSLGVVFGLVGWFLLKAAIEFDPQEPVGVGGALAKLAHASYGGWLLGITAAGLIVFGLFDLFQGRYHKA
jgi:hypothetical protein